MVETYLFHRLGKNFGAGTYSYNRDSIFVVSSSIFLFLSFVKIEFKSTIVNWIASSSFFVYIISENANLWKSPYSIYDILGVSGWAKTSQYTILVIGASLAVFFLCILIDKLRKLLLGGLEHKIGGIAENFQQKLIIKNL